MPLDRQDDATRARLGVIGAVAALTAVGAALRFSTLGLQSFWFDEVVTVDIVEKSFGSMLRDVANLTPTPPLYYVIAWVWTRAFGASEVGLRSLSALVGTAAIPLAYGCGTSLHSRRAGLFAASLVAVSPLLVWYSQEARAYALLATLSAASFLFFIRALEHPTSRVLTLWTAFSALALLTHYFAIFVVAPEAALLVLAMRRLRVALSIAALVVLSLPLAALAVHQENTGQVAWIAGIPREARARELVARFLGGGYEVPHATLGAALLAALVVALLVVSADRRARRAVIVAGGVAALALAVPLVLSFLGHDYFFFRNLIVAWLPLALCLAIALASSPSRTIGLAAVFALSVVCLVVAAVVWSRPALQRDDWRGFVQRLARIQPPAAVVTRPFFEHQSLEHYAPSLSAMRADGVAVRSIVVVGYPFFGDAFPPSDLRLPSQFKLTTTEKFGGRLRAVIYRAPHPIAVTPSDFSAGAGAGEAARSVLTRRANAGR
jgi:mannosyltransferase